MLNRAWIVSITLVVMPIASVAQNAPGSSDSSSRYSFVEAGAGYLEFDGRIAGVNLSGENGTGPELAGSLTIGQNFFAFAGFHKTPFSIAIGNTRYGIDYSRYQVGLGVFKMVTGKTSIDARLGYAGAEATIGGVATTLNYDGFTAGVALRSRVSPRFEFEVGADYLDLGDLGDDGAGRVDGRYFVYDWFSIGLGASVASDSTAARLTFRYSFN